MATQTALRPGEIKDILLREIQAADLADLNVEEVGTVLEVKDGIAPIYGLGKVMAGEMPEFTSSETKQGIPRHAPNPRKDNHAASHPGRAEPCRSSYAAAAPQQHAHRGCPPERNIHATGNLS